MLKKTILLFSLFLCAAVYCKAQSGKDFTGPFPEKPPTPDLTATERQHQSNIHTHRKIKAFKWQRGKVTHTAQFEYYKRVEEAAKAHQRELKKLYKPQYSDFLYFGHKNKPRKHKPGQLRYCKECGLRH